MQGIGRVSQSGESGAPSEEGSLRVSRGVDRGDSSLASSNPERASEPCLFIRLVGGFFSWIGKKWSGLCNACSVCFCGARGSSAETNKSETEEDSISESRAKTEPHVDPTPSSSGKKTDHILTSGPETETHEDPTLSSSSEEEEREASTSESEEDPTTKPVPELQVSPGGGGDISFSGLLGLLEDKPAPAGDSSKINAPPHCQEQALKAASDRFKEVLEQWQAHSSEDLESRKRELLRLIENREGLAFISRPPGEKSLEEVVGLFDQFIGALGDGPTVLDSALLSDDVTMSMFVVSLDMVCAASDRQVNFKKELTTRFVVWLECFGPPAYRFILEKKIAEITTILEAMIEQIENIGPAIGDSLNDSLFAHATTDCGGAAEQQRKALRKQLILNHLRNITMEGGEESFRQRVPLIQESLQVLNANVRRGETLASILPLDDRGNSTRELKLGEINGLLGKIGALFGLDENASPYIYIEGINDREHAFRSLRG